MPYAWQPHVVPVQGTPFHLMVEAMFNSLIGMVIHAIIPKKRAIYQVPSSKLHSYLKKPL